LKEKKIKQVVVFFFFEEKQVVVDIIRLRKCFSWHRWL